jgi:rSAM/selenodomain-associated transferase 2
VSVQQPTLSIIVPVLNDAEPLHRLLESLSPWRARGNEVIVVDGGSSDDSVARARHRADTVICAERGRAQQMNAGAAVANGKVLWFVHADTDIPFELHEELLRFESSNRQWGRFDVRIDHSAWQFRVIETLMNWRSRGTAIATGDQAIFVRRDLFNEVGGYTPIALMEDLELCARLRRISAPLCCRSQVRTSARRWLIHGIATTVLKMWLLRFAWFCGVAPAKLARLYGYR